MRWAQRREKFIPLGRHVHGEGWHLGRSLEDLSNDEEEGELPVKIIDYAKACRSVGWMWWEKESKSNVERTRS